MIDIDGSRGEGGGQILRSSLALSALTGKPFRITRVRAGRPKPGLAAQHLASVNAAAAVCNATVDGAALGSAEVTFRPGSVTGGHFRLAVGTAGATPLVLHTAYLPLALRGTGTTTLEIEGGTHVLAAPSADFLETTWRAHLAAMGLPVGITLERPGFYPRGGGRLVVTVPGVPHLTGYTPTPAPEASKIPVTATATVAGLDPKIGTRMLDRVQRRLHGGRYDVIINSRSWQNGPAVFLTLTTPGAGAPATFVALGERGTTAERVADAAIGELLAFVERGSAIDPHSADQLLLPAAFAAGPSRFDVTEVTQHTLTNVETIRAFTDARIRVSGAEGEPGTIGVEPATVGV